MTPFEEVVAWYGTQANLARAFGVTTVAVTNWKNLYDGKFPPEIAIELERRSMGKWKAVEIAGKRNVLTASNG